MSVRPAFSSPTSPLGAPFLDVRHGAHGAQAAQAAQCKSWLAEVCSARTLRVAPFSCIEPLSRSAQLQDLYRHSGTAACLTKTRVAAESFARPTNALRTPIFVPLFDGSYFCKGRTLPLPVLACLLARGVSLYGYLDTSGGQYSFGAPRKTGHRFPAMCRY